MERLLHSPHYGERWARHWLDAARYADSDGFEKDKPRQVWFYRDWVINALNRDLPYNQFVIEQIAGDLLPNRHAGSDGGHRVPAQLDDQRRGRHRSRAVPHGGDVRSHGRDRQERSWASPFSARSATTTSTIRSRRKNTTGMFAFLNNSHEANIAVVHAGRADEARGDLPADSGDRRRSCSIGIPDGQERMAQWEDKAKAISRSGPWCSLTSTTSRTAGKNICRWRMARSWRRATRRRSTRVKMTVKTDAAEHHRVSAGAAERSESAAGRSGPIDQGHLRADRVQSGSSAGGCGRRNQSKVKIRRAHGGYQSAGDAAGSHLRRQDRHERA